QDQNLCVKIYRVLEKEFKLPPVHIHLHKNIPIGAGLGGGSSDAAFTIKALNQLFCLGLSDDSMEKYMRPLGSDCAFFIRNKPVFAYNKGDHFEELNLSLAGKFICLAYPPIHISTREAYAGIKPQQPVVSIKDILKMEKSSWKDLLKNDFETEIFRNHPQLLHLKESLYGQGAFYASMSGSGSCVYGIFDDKEQISRLQLPSSCTTFSVSL
ncbi:MAG: 4-(cytidine 5'-diphospho)-2-C-methyl-D-erythritol kinase, partial [Cytophagaceae bacterium]